ncbi:MAG TPA: enoyl-CoA hydratase-related protein, partial [Acidimicrobiales bacterium]|nr:enoyl-CoA hydratase-related protein [Acidimicrobiales bacterium]
MAETFVSVERRPDGVALVRLDRPKANALSAAVLGQLQEAATGLVDDPPGAVVLWGGRRIFAAGADIVELEDIGAEAVARNFAAALDALAAVPRATVAAVNGFALGGGLELALA